ncbi:hypothetical protein A5721_18795 [Mycobacterium vulneris]|nr:hypothetical protein A5721_18795 [Mycolicibacterium vulneris]
MMSDHDHRPDADTCRDCGRRGRERDGCNCIRDAFNDLVRTELAMSPPVCECKCDGLEPHADRPCTASQGGPRRRATTLVALHMVGMCDMNRDGVRPPDVDQLGNLCAYMCTPCADHAYAVSRRKVEQLRSMFPVGVTPRCPTCGRDIACADDVIARLAI